MGFWAGYTYVMMFLSSGHYTELGEGEGEPLKGKEKKKKLKTILLFPLLLHFNKQTDLTTSIYVYKHMKVKCASSVV